MFRAWDIDFDQQTVRVEFLTGEVVEDALTSVVPPGSAVRRSRVEFQRRVLILSLDDGQKIEVDIGVADQPAPADVPVLYLDQLHWISLAQHLWAPDRLREPERAAAAILIALARTRRILLPLAAAHLTEMASLFAKRRRDLAATILGLCRGWQMKSPMRIRAEEYVASLLGQNPVARDVFTLEPGLLFAEGPALPAPVAGVPPEVADITVRVIAASAVYSAVLDDKPLDMREAEAAAQRWATNFPPLAAHIRQRRMNGDDARLNAYARLLADQRDDIARAAASSGASQEHFDQWLAERLPSAVSQMPYVGRLGEVLYLRLRNADDKWHGHDLNDMNFLCAAAGYADITVGEKKTIEYLRRARPRIPQGSLLARRLSEAVDLLAERGIAP